MADIEVVNTSDETFDTDVDVRSQLGLVVVDFWADWCAPCRMLAPVLESAISKFGDRVTLVKAETEKNQQASQRFGVSGIPAVFGVYDGKVIDSFQGALPEEQIRGWIESCLAKLDLETLRDQLDSDPAGVVASVSRMPTPDDSAKVILLQALYQTEDFEGCSTLLSKLEARGFLEAECERIKSQLSLRHDSDTDVDELRAEAAANPEDLELQLKLAKELASSQDYEACFEICLRLVQVDRKNTGESARLLMLDVFRIEGDDSDLTRDYRRKLSMVLY